MEPTKIDATELKVGQKVKLTQHSEVWEVQKITDDWVTFISDIGVVRWYSKRGVVWAYLVEESNANL